MSWPKATLICTRVDRTRPAGRGSASGLFRGRARLLGLGLLQERGSEGRGPVRPGGQLVLQRSPPGVERVADVVVQEAAQRRHVDVSKAGQAPQEVGGILVCAEQASELGVEEIFGHFSEEARKEQSQTEQFRRVSF